MSAFEMTSGTLLEVFSLDGLFDSVVKPNLQPDLYR